jgi:hypothetical protein
MKNLKLIVFFSFIVIISFGTLPLQALTSDGARHLSARKSSPIAYVVRIENQNYVQSGNTHYLIVLTDGAGQQAASQAFRPGIADYTFYENGPVKGTRVARLMRLPLGPHSNDIPATSKTGIFQGGTTYLFLIRMAPVEQADHISRQ